MMLIDNKLNIEDLVYISTDVDQKKRIITAICVRPNGVSYEVSCGIDNSWHFDFELSIEKDVIMSIDG